MLLLLLLVVVYGFGYIGLLMTPLELRSFDPHSECEKKNNK